MEDTLNSDNMFKGPKKFPNSDCSKVPCIIHHFGGCFNVANAMYYILMNIKNK